MLPAPKQRAGGLTLHDVQAGDIEVGDTFEIEAGCDKLKATCKDKFANLVNFRGHGVFTPGTTEILKVGPR